MIVVLTERVPRGTFSIDIAAQPHLLVEMFRGWHAGTWSIKSQTRKRRGRVVHRARRPQGRRYVGVALVLCVERNN